MKSEEIYVALKNEGTAVLRPVSAEKLENGVYKIDKNFVYDSEDEELEFLPSEVVLCEKQKLSGGKFLVAIKKKEI